jgi:ATP-binding cassette subfamily B protein
VAAVGFGVDAMPLVLMAVLAVQAPCSYLQTYWLAAVGERGLADLRRDTYARLIHLPMAFFAGRRVGELASRLAADLALIQQTFTGTLPHFLGQMVMLAGGLVLITLTSGRLTLVMLASVPLVIGLAVVFGKLSRKVAREGQDRLADTNVVVEETLQGIASVKAFANEDYEINRYRSGIDEFISVVLRGARYGVTLAYLGQPRTYHQPARQSAPSIPPNPLHPPSLSPIGPAACRCRSRS